jgi:hypothetical protein
MPPPPGHLAGNPLPPGIVGALGLRGYQLLGEVAGVGVGRLGEQAFLLAAGDPEPDRADPGTQISLHHQRLRDEAELASWLQLAAQLGYLRLSGYRLALERDGLRSNINLVDPGSGRIAARQPTRGSAGAREPGFGAAAAERAPRPPRRGPAARRARSRAAAPGDPRPRPGR